MFTLIYTQLLTQYKYLTGVTKKEQSKRHGKTQRSVLFLIRKRCLKQYKKNKSTQQYWTDSGLRANTFHFVKS